MGHELGVGSVLKGGLPRGVIPSLKTLSVQVSSRERPRGLGASLDQSRSGRTDAIATYTIHGAPVPEESLWTATRVSP